MSLRTRFGGGNFWAASRPDSGSLNVAPFYGDGDREASYKDDVKCFQQHVDMFATKPFALKQVVMTTGPYAGRKALVMVPATLFPFGKLAPELRNMIYDMVLCPSTVHVCRDNHHGSRMSSNYGREQRRKGNRTSMSLLLVDRQIGAEAKDWLYKHSVFCFEATRTFIFFMERIGKAKSLIRHVTIDRTGTEILFECYPLLVEATRLQSFTVCLAQNFKGTLQEHIKKQSESLRAYLLAEKADEEEALRRLNIIIFKVKATQSGVFDASGKPIKVITAEMNERCREYIRRLVEKHFRKISTK